MPSALLTELICRHVFCFSLFKLAFFKCICFVCLCVCVCVCCYSVTYFFFCLLHMDPIFIPWLVSFVTRVIATLSSCHDNFNL